MDASPGTAGEPGTDLSHARCGRTDQGGLPGRSEAVLDAGCEGTHSQGVGAERTCDLRGGITIRERWLAWKEGGSFTYEGLGIPLVARARNEWTVQPEGDQTLLLSQAEVILKGGPLRRLLEPILTFQFEPGRPADTRRRSART